MDGNFFRGRVRIIDDVIHISSTSIQEFASCSMKGYYSKVKGLYLLGPPVAALKFGSVVHEVMAEYLTRQLTAAPFLDKWIRFRKFDMFYNKQEEDWDRLANVGITIVKHLIDLLEMYRAGDPYLVGGKKPAVEVQSSVKIAPGIILTRTFDAILPLDGIPTVVDFKTSGKIYTEGLQDAVSEQLTAYLLPHRLKGVPQPKVAAFFVGTKAKTTKSGVYIAERDESRFKQFRRDVVNIADMIRNKRYIRNRSAMTCGSANNPYCNYYHLCYKTPGVDVKSLYGKAK